jgi:hypothetical protein
MDRMRVRAEVAEEAGAGGAVSNDLRLLRAGHPGEGVARVDGLALGRSAVVVAERPVVPNLVHNGIFKGESIS